MELFICANVKDICVDFKDLSREKAYTFMKVIKYVGERSDGCETRKREREAGCLKRG